MSRSRIDAEFERLNAANTALMQAVSDGERSDFDFEQNGPEKCNELEALVLDLAKSEFTTKFHEAILAIPEDASIEERTRMTIYAASMICTDASRYKWSNFGMEQGSEGLRVGKFIRTNGHYYYDGREITLINNRLATIDAFLLEKFLKTPGHFLTDASIAWEINGRSGAAKHRISSLRKALNSLHARHDLIVRKKSAVSYSEANGYQLNID